MRISKEGGVITFNGEGCIILQDVSKLESMITIESKEVGFINSSVYGYTDEISYMELTMFAKKVKGRKLILAIVKVINWVAKLFKN